jgi:hypothetical protein
VLATFFESYFSHLLPSLHLLALFHLDAYVEQHQALMSEDHARCAAASCLRVLFCDRATFLMKFAESVPLKVKVHDLYLSPGGVAGCLHIARHRGLHASEAPLPMRSLNCATR